MITGEKSYITFHKKNKLRLQLEVEVGEKTIVGQMGHRTKHSGHSFRFEPQAENRFVHPPRGEGRRHIV